MDCKQGHVVVHSRTCKELAHDNLVERSSLGIMPYESQVAKKNREEDNAKVGHVFNRVCQGIDDHIQALVGFEGP